MNSSGGQALSGLRSENTVKGKGTPFPDMSEVSPQELLDAKEARVARRGRFQEKHPGTCVSLSLNMPGPIKDSPRIRTLFRHALERVGATLDVSALLSAHEKTGPHAVFAVEGEPAAVKELACRLESETEYARLLDIDVYDREGKAVSSPGRGAGRTCFVCGDLAIACQRERRHDPAEIMARVEKFFTAFHADMSRSISAKAAYYGSLGIESMLCEAAASPSPGLVDPFHSGSHRDMDFFTFQRSSAAIAFGLTRCVEAGIRHQGADEALLPVLRAIGLEAEKDMFRATGGVNTQKGLLFSLGLALGATGLLVGSGASVTPEAVCARLREMTKGIVARELEAARAAPETAGERMYRAYGISGIRGEMEAGLPSVINTGLPTLRRALDGGEESNRAMIRALVSLMAVVDDTTILARASGFDALGMVQAKAGELQNSGLLDSPDWREAVLALDAELVRRNLSPGGSADLLALTWFMHKVEKQAGGPLLPRSGKMTTSGKKTIKRGDHESAGCDVDAG
ncbi:MAG: triphosphoribosyl-dephospho-CoA synthase CitG [Desulfovibrio sp.]|nr:triphosphoribosyl-dephospho-CoA synthase CitG [Desulfovibrio sp.]